MKRRVMMDIFSGCSVKCAYCLHQNLGLAKTNRMDLETFSIITDILYREGYRYVYPYLSGEPLLHDHYWEFMVVLSELGITSNTATKLPVPLKEWEVRAAMERIDTPMIFTVTVDAYYQATASRMSRIVLKNVYDNLTMLADVKGPKVTVDVVTIVNNYNAHEMSEICQWVTKHGFSWAKKDMGFYMDRRADEESRLEIMKMIPANSSRMKVRDGKIVSRRKACTNFLKPVIGYKGDVTICCHDMLFEMNAGNVLKTGSLDAVLGSQEYQEYTRRGREMKLPICRGCN